ncbi:MAG: hypothetical protein AAF845_07810 [Bacteroidota bacterium]
MSAAPMIENETDQPRTPAQARGSVLPRDNEEEDPRLPLPTDDEIPGETIAMLGQASDALVRLIGAVFQAATEIVGALLRLVQTIAGRDAAEAVDQTVADAIDPLIPDPPRSTPEDPEVEPPGETPTDDAPSTDDKAPTASGDDREALRDGVQDVLETYARTDEEREALSPAFIEMVTTGVQFLLSVERQFPGAIDALQARDRGEAPEDSPSPEAPQAPEAGPRPDETPRPEQPAPESTVLMA